MTHRGPFQPLLFCDSVILFSSARRQEGKVQFRRQEDRTAEAGRDLWGPSGPSASSGWATQSQRPRTTSQQRLSSPKDGDTTASPSCQLSGQPKLTKAVLKNVKVSIKFSFISQRSPGPVGEHSVLHTQTP